MSDAMAGAAAGDEQQTQAEVDFFESSPLADMDWAEGDWEQMLVYLVESGLVTYQEVAALVLGHLNPSQVGTSIASKKTFQAHYPPRKTMQAVLAWHINQEGVCVDCGTRLELQADHVETREEYGDAADRLENMTLRCRRCNVIRRPSHANGGKTFLTTESALMWILLVKRPGTYLEYERLCRNYGLTMANIRFKEAWAMAHWLQRVGLYTIDDSSTF
ncbi:HNH endonuclease [Demequina activiva]|nr:HNH endonuclease [Demequina activiva]